ncbi:MAG: acetolactate synthase large subunit, partial [Variibacter sp.]|nr:acetolactate synthase large subunit [Variibacter sp.]
MRAKNNTRSGAEVLVDQLTINGVQHAFCVPGESYLAVLDAFHDRSIAMTVCRQEGGCAMMAEAVGKLTGRPGVAFVTRGPGATNASPAVHIARQDSTPMLLFVGQIGRDMREREAFQELDYRAVFGTMAKWATEIDNPERIPEIISRAFYVATTGRPGPVVIALPEDMLTEQTSIADALAVEPFETWPGLTDMAQLQKLLWAAERPVALLGGSRWTAQACAALARFAERFALPVATTFRRMDVFDALHPSYAGDFGIAPNPALLDYVKGSDLVLLIGGRLGEMPSQGYSLIGIPTPQMKFVHVHAGAEELGRVYSPALAINASPAAFAASAEGLQPPAKLSWSAETKRLHESYLAWTEKPNTVPGSVNLGEIMVWLRDKLPKDAIITNGAGNFATWVPRYYRFRQRGTYLGPISGSMGYGLPAAVGAKRLYPDRTVVCIAGDGDFLMHGQEFATAVQYDLPFVTVLMDNGMYGTIRMHQEREYPGRVSGTQLKNPDFAAYARAFGGFGASVDQTKDFAGAFEEAVRS